MQAAMVKRKEGIKMTTIDTLLLSPFRDMVYKVASYVPTLVSALIILLVGIFVAKVLRVIFHRLLTELKFDILSDKIGLSGALHKGGVKHKFSDLVASLVHLVVMVIFVLMTVDHLGVTMSGGMISGTVAYLPQVVAAVLALALGLIIAKVVASVIYVITTHVGFPKPKIYERVTRWAITIYAIKVTVIELGFGEIFVGTPFYILFGGVVLALALAYGLGGKDKAAKYFAKK